jgi:hypothetical protein
MLGSVLSEFAISGTVKDVAQSGSTMCVLSTGRLNVYDLSKFKQTKFIDTTNTFHALGFLSSTVIGAFSLIQNTPVTINISTGAITTLGAAGYPQYDGKGQQAAGDSANHVLGISDASGALLRIDGSGPTASTITPAAMSGKKASAIIAKPGVTDAFIVGSTDGVIWELNFAGTVVKTITLPIIPNDGAGRGHPITHLSMTGDNLFVQTGNGVWFHYTYSTSTIVTQRLMGNMVAVATGFSAMGEAVNGFFPFVHGDIAMANAPICLFHCNPKPALCVDFTTFPENSKVTHVGLNGSVGALWAACDSPSRIRFWSLPGLNTSAYETRVQDPPGTDVTARILRLPVFPTVGTTRVEEDTTIPAAATTLTAKIDDQDYLEVTLTGTQFVSEKYGARVFES